MPFCHVVHTICHLSFYLDHPDVVMLPEGSMLSVDLNIYNKKVCMKTFPLLFLLFFALLITYFVRLNMFCIYNKPQCMSQKRASLAPSYPPIPLPASRGDGELQ